MKGVIMGWVKDSEGGALIEVLVKPNSRNPGIKGVEEGKLVVHVSAPPREGRANEELIKVLKKLLRTRVELIAGLRSTVKTVKACNLTSEEVKAIIDKYLRGRR